MILTYAMFVPDLRFKMVASIPKTKAQEIIEQISVFGRKDASEFTIHRWKIHAKSLEASNFLESKRLQAIIAVYENDFETAYKNFDSSLSRSDNKNSMIYSDYGQALLMHGRGEEAIEFFLKAFDANPSMFVLERLLSSSASFLFLDPLSKVISIIEKYDINQDKYVPLIEQYQDSIKRKLEYLEEIKVSKETYRLVINTSDYVLYNSFYTQTKYSYHLHDDCLNVIIYPESLSEEDVSKLNDDFIENLVELDISSDELVKISVYFSNDVYLEEKVVA